MTGSKLPANPTANVPAKKDDVCPKSQYEELKKANMSPMGAFMKTSLGKVIYGDEEVQIEPDSLWAINPRSLQAGFVTWDDPSKAGAGPLEEKMAYTGQERTMCVSDCTEFPNSRRSAINSLTLSCMTGDDKSQLAVIKVSSGKGRDAVTELFGWISEAIPAGQAKNYVPVVKLTVGAAKTKFGPYSYITFNPVGVYTVDQAKKIVETGSLKNIA